MKKHVPYMMASGLIAAILLGGCSSTADTAASSGSNSQAAQTQSDSSAAQPSASPEAGEQGMNGMDRAGMNIGKIKSISGSVITVYTAETPAGRPQNAGEDGEGAAPEGQGTPPEGGEATPPEGQGTPPEDGEGAAPEGQVPGGMTQNFSEETTDITVDSDTQYVSVTFNNGEQTETVLSLADLKADDIIQYTLNTDTGIAEKVTLGAGGFGGGQGGAPGGSDAQGSTEAADASGSNSN